MSALNSKNSRNKPPPTRFTFEPHVQQASRGIAALITGAGVIMHSTDACAVSEGKSHGCRKGNALMKTNTRPNCKFNQLRCHFENEEPERHSEVHGMNADSTVQKVIVLSLDSSVPTIFTSLYVLFYCIWLYWKTLWWNPLEKCSRNPFHVVAKGFSSCSVEWLQPYITGARMKWPEVDLSGRKLALTRGNAFNLRKSWVRRVNKVLLFPPGCTHKAC